MDKKPKRRKYKNNPYKLEKLEEKQIYNVSFKDNKGNSHKIAVSSEIYEVFDQFELTDLKEMNEFDRHIEHLEQTDEFLYNRTIEKQQSIEHIVENNILIYDLKKAINNLSKVQKKRIQMYYFEDMTMEKIAKSENCSKTAIKHSLDYSIKKLKEILKK